MCPQTAMTTQPANGPNVPGPEAADPFTTAGTKAGKPVAFDVGRVHVIVHPPAKGRFAHYLLLRATAAGFHVLLASGSEDTLMSCLEKASAAASRLARLQS